MHLRLDAALGKMGAQAVAVRVPDDEVVVAAAGGHDLDSLQGAPVPGRAQASILVPDSQHGQLRPQHRRLYLVKAAIPRRTIRAHIFDALHNMARADYRPSVAHAAEVLRRVEGKGGWNGPRGHPVGLAGVHQHEKACGCLQNRAHWQRQAVQGYRDHRPRLGRPSASYGFRGQKRPLGRNLDRDGPYPLDRHPRRLEGLEGDDYLVAGADAARQQPEGQGIEAAGYPGAGVGPAVDGPFLFKIFYLRAEDVAPGCRDIGERRDEAGVFVRELVEGDHPMTILIATKT